MPHPKIYDAIIIGGSYAGLSAAMALGRAIRNVLVIDSGLPCNRQTPHSHNFITQDGEKPHRIAEKAKAQVSKYETVEFEHDRAVSAEKTDGYFEVHTQSGSDFFGKKLIFASGVKDIMPEIPGFAECWGISVIHCPYCHGYEVKMEKTGILANGDMAFHYAQLISNWTKDITLFTNGKSVLTKEQSDQLQQRNISVVEKDIQLLKNENGHLEEIVFKDDSVFKLKAMYARPAYEQHCGIPETLGCEITEHGLLKVDMFQKTTIDHVFACGDNTTLMRSVANAVAGGNMAGAVLNNELVAAEF